MKEVSVVKKNQNGQQTKRRMSNAELTARVKRLRLEAEYSRLVKETTPVTVSKIDKAINAANTISKMSKSFVKNPNDIVHVGDIVTCYVADIDLTKQKVQLSLIKNS